MVKKLTPDMVELVDDQYLRVQIPGTNGGFVQIKLDDEGVIVDLFNAADDTESLSTAYAFYYELGETVEEREDRTNWEAAFPSIDFTEEE